MTDRDKLLAATADNWRGREVVLPNENFTWRSELLRSFALRLMDIRGSNSSAPQGVVSFLPLYCDRMHSGVTSSCAEELALHGFTRVANEAPTALRIALENVAETAPSDISGGEHVLLALGCAIALDSEAFLIDGALEQLDQQKKTAAIAWIRASSAARWTVFVDGRGAWPNRMSLAQWSTIADRIAPRPEWSTLPVVTPGRCSFRPIVRLESNSWSATQISIERLTFAYPHGRGIFAEASFEWTPGRIYQLAGDNGSGKTTLAKLLCKAVTPKAGRLEFIATRDGCSFEYKSGKASPISIAFQNPDHSLVSNTPRDELDRRSKALLGSIETGTTQNETANIWLETFGLASLSRRPTVDLPFTARKRLAIAAAFAQATPWIFLDEPTLGQDSAFKAVLSEILLHQASRGRGCIVVSHDEDWIHSLPHCRVAIRERKLVEER